MLKKLILMLVLCGKIGITYAMDRDLEQIMHTPITLPDQTKIKEIIRKITGTVFVEVTKIDEYLGDSKLSPLRISEIVAELIKYFQHPQIKRIDRFCPNFLTLVPIDEEQRHPILKAILRDSPNVYQKLLKYEAQKQSKL